MKNERMKSLEHMECYYAAIIIEIFLYRNLNDMFE